MPSPCPKYGEQVCGDAWCAVAGDEGELRLMMADGLGHGPAAATAAVEAVRLFRRFVHEDPASVVAHIHAGMRHTRGAAVAVARLQPDRGRATFCGVGNIAGTILGNGQTRRTVSQNGTAGLSARRIQAFDYDLPTPFLFVLNSDGLHTNWSIERYRSLQSVHPVLLAGVLYRDFSRGRDDVSVLVAHGRAAWARPIITTTLQHESDLVAVRQQGQAHQ